MNGPIKVAVLLPSLNVGGAERLVIEELAWLKNDPEFSFAVHLVFEKGLMFETLRSLGLPFFVWDAPHKSVRMLGQYAAIIRHIRANKYHILHSHLLDGIGPLVGKLAGVRVVATAHIDKEYTAVERFVLALSDLVLACGQRVSENVGRFIPPGKIARLDNAIRMPEKRDLRRADIVRKFGIKPGSRILLTLGRLTRQKGIDVLLRSFSEVAHIVPDAFLLIGGDGEERANLERMAKSLHCSDRIRFAGMIGDVHEVLSVCDLYINSSRCEGLPMTLLEAMSHALPIIATRVGCNHEVIHDGETGMLVPPDDPKRLSEAIVGMLRDDQFRKKVGSAAHDFFCRSYTIDQHCTKLKEFYLRVFSRSTN